MRSATASDDPARALWYTVKDTWFATSGQRAVVEYAIAVLGGQIGYAGLLARDVWLERVGGALIGLWLFHAAIGALDGSDDSVTPARPPKGSIWKLSDADFDRLIDAVELEATSLGGGVVPAADEFAATRDADFASLVRDALDELPEFVQAELELNVVVAISDDGHERCAYGLYHGRTATDADVPRRIVIFRDTLEADFGHDPRKLREQVGITVRHEVAHHLGAREPRIAALGL